MTDIAETMSSTDDLAGELLFVAGVTVFVGAITMGLHALAEALSEKDRSRDACTWGR